MPKPENLGPGFIHIPIIIIAVVGVLVFASATVLGFREAKSRPFRYICGVIGSLPGCEQAVSPLPKSTTSLQSTPGLRSSFSPIPTSYPASTKKPASELLPSPGVSPTPSADGSITYRQPQGKYTINLPSDWVVNLPSATAAYSTTKFTGPSGYVSITFGSGKDPIGGCSETSPVVLFDRTISGCFLLQKDGSQILTRGYTKDKAGIDFTIEAYMNPPLSYHRPVVLSVIGTIDIE